MSQTTDELTEALRALCRDAGLLQVADAAGLSAENLKQILAGYKLPSGNPRGVGRHTRARLDETFPTWLEDYRAHVRETTGAQDGKSAQAITVARTPYVADSPTPTYFQGESLGSALKTIGRAISRLPQEQRAQLAAEMKLWVEFGGQASHLAAVEATLSHTTVALGKVAGL